MNDIAGIIISLNGEHKIAEALASLKGFVPVVHVFVDCATTDNTKAVAASSGAVVHDIETPGFVDAVMPAVCKIPGTRYIMRLDDDERLMRAPGNPAEQAGALLSSMREQDVSHLMFCRRWVLPGKTHYIASRPWYPDLQMRIFDFEKAQISWAQAPHMHPEVTGKRAFVNTVCIDHYDLCFTDPETRRAKAKAYTALNPDKAHLERFYCYEDYELTISPVGQLIPIIERY